MVKRLLVLDGGGIRGVITLKFLSLMEKNLGIDVSTYFDYFAGTSTGGLIASLMAYNGYSATKILDEIYTLDTMRKIMTQDYYGWAMSRMQIRSKYNDVQKLFFIQEHIGGQVKMSDVKRPLLLVAFKPSSKIPVFFRNYFHNPNYLLSEACNATSAAPTYFPLAKVNVPTENIHSSKRVDDKDQETSSKSDLLSGKEVGQCYHTTAIESGIVPVNSRDDLSKDVSLKEEVVEKKKQDDFFWAVDGGIFANNPSDLAYVDAKTLFKSEKLQLLSVGTGICRSKFHQVTNPALGGWNWMIDDSIIDLFLDSNQVASHIKTKHMASNSGDEYLRVNEYLQCASADLDDTTPKNYQKLLEEGESWWKLYRDNMFFKHIPSDCLVA